MLVFYVYLYHYHRICQESIFMPAIQLLGLGNARQETKTMYTKILNGTSVFLSGAGAGVRSFKLNGGDRN